MARREKDGFKGMTDDIPTLTLEQMLAFDESLRGKVKTVTLPVKIPWLFGKAEPVKNADGTYTYTFAASLCDVLGC